MERTVVWQMIKEAIDALKGSASYSDIESYVIEKWGDVNKGTIEKQIIAVTVNHPSRKHYTENHKPRLSNSNSQYDFLYRTSRGQVVKYDPGKHGIWEIFINDAGKPEVRKYNEAATYLFAWNPENFPWVELKQQVEQLRNSGNLVTRWSCVSHKKIKIGDRAFLVKLGKGTNGIMGSGYVVSSSFLAPHWSLKDKQAHRVMIEFDVLLNPENEPLLKIEELNSGDYDKNQWTPRGSGVPIKPELVHDLEERWFKFTESANISSEPSGNKDAGRNYIEGQAVEVVLTRYERNPYARGACLEHYGYACSVCDFDFKEYYGEIGQNFIHVHHLTQISTADKPYLVDPVKHLRPVCPNCHAMLHKRNIPYTIEELKSKIKKE